MVIEKVITIHHQFKNGSSSFGTFSAWAVLSLAKFDSLSEDLYLVRRSSHLRFNLGQVRHIHLL